MIPATILEALHSPQWWKPWFTRGDWTAWRAFLSTVFALPMDDELLAIYRECTGRTDPPATRASEAWAICGRRSGKTRILSTVAAYLAAFVDWRPQLAPGEKASVMLLAADRRQARNALRYLRALFVDHPTLAKMVVRESDESLELSNDVVIEITTASYRTTRGYTVCACLCDEVAFWFDDDRSSNPATEVITALRAAGATLEGSLLLVASSPHARKGALWEAYKRHYGEDGDPILVWKAPTRRMNPSVKQSIIDEALALDRAKAASEWLADFRDDLESFVTREQADRVVVPGRDELAPMEHFAYHVFVDAAGGSGSDSMTVGVAHDDNGTTVLDHLGEVRPPFSPRAVVADVIVPVCRAYRTLKVVGDRYASQWVAEQFHLHGVQFEPSERTKSQIYAEFAPLVTSGKVKLLDHPRMLAQLVDLERRVGFGSNKESVDHPRAGHDDLINSAAGACVLATSNSDLAIWNKLGGGPAFPPWRAPFGLQ